MTIRQTTMPWMQGYDFGVGVDLVSTSPMAKVVNDVHTAAAAGATVDFEVTRVRTTSDLEAALDISVEASYGSALFGAGAKARLDFVKGVHVQTSSLFMSVTATVKLAFLSINDPQLTDDAASLVDRPDIFNQRFGDTFVRGMLLGGLFVGVIQIDAQSSSDSESISTELSGTYGLFSADAKEKFQKIQSKYNASSSVQMYHEGGPVDLKIEDTTDPNEILKNANLFLQSFKDSPNAVGVAYQVTLAPIAIARGPLPLNEANIEHAQDVLAFCARRRSVLLDQLNGLQYIVDNPSRFDFSNGAKIEVVAQALSDTQIDLDLIAQCASAAINHPGTASLPVEYAAANGAVFPKAMLPSPMPVAKIGSAVSTAVDVKLTSPPTPTYNVYGMLQWAGWGDFHPGSEDAARVQLRAKCAALARLPAPSYLETLSHIDLDGVAAVIIFLLKTNLRSPAQLQTMTLAEQRTTVIVEDHNNTGRPIAALQTYANADLVDIGLNWAYPLISA